MNKIRIIVEWVFKEITQQFAYFDWFKTQKLWLQPLGKEYTVAILFHNAYVCLYYPQIHQYLKIHNKNQVRVANNGYLFTPPTLEEYFHN